MEETSDGIEFDPRKVLDLLAGMTEQEKRDFSDALEGCPPDAPGGAIRDLMRRKEAESN